MMNRSDTKNASFSHGRSRQRRWKLADSFPRFSTAACLPFSPCTPHADCYLRREGPEKMTKKLPKSPMELDLDSFLQSQSTTSDSDSDSELDSIHRRTVDEILNDSSSSPSSSYSSPSTSPGRRNVQIPEPPFPSPAIPNLDQTPEPPPSSSEPKIFPSFATRRKPGEFSGTSLSLGRSYSRPLPLLFEGVKPNPKPGAALAAAAAASRSIPTPHAAAIKFRRASGGVELLRGEDRQGSADSVAQNEAGLEESQVLDRLGLAPDDGGSVAAGSESAQLDEKSAGEDDSLGNSLSLKSQWDLGDSAEVLQSSDEFQAFQEVQDEQKEDFHVDEWDSVDSNSLPEKVVHAVSDSTDMINEMHICDPSQTSNASGREENSAFIDSADDVDKHDVSCPMDEQNSQVEEDPISLRCEIPDLDMNTASENKDGEGKNLRRDSTEHIEDILNQLENKRTSKKSGKKWQSSKRLLELAEELEKKHASSGLHWEEGAAAQPMRLEGIRRGPPAVGYLQIDPDNAITRMISSSAFRRDHGSAQVLAVHMNFIAVGMSRGAVLLVPSKYSTRYPDSMDAKMSLLGSQGGHSSVTSMCFNQQGDLLLVGYGNGHVTVWDVLRASAVKTITEHSAPVVHTLFLGQDSQVTRQFKVVTGDCKGIVFLHAFSVVPLLNRFSIKSQCLLNGQNTGIVLSASALLIDDLHGSGLMSAQGNAAASPSSLGSMMGGVVGGVVGGEAGWKLFSEGSSFVEEGVVIFVTHQTVLVVRLVPSLEFYARLSKPNGVREGSMPYTAWKCVVYLRVSSTEHIPADASEKASFLAIAWDRKLQVAMLVKSELKIQKEWTLDSAAIGVAWLDDQMLVVLTVRGQLFLFSKEGTEIHRTSFVVDNCGRDDIIAYHTHFFNVDGNPEKAYHNSIAVRGATIYILGPTHLVVSRLLPWKERIQVLQKAGDWMGALDMAMRLYDGQTHGVIDLPRTIDAIQEAIMPYMVELLLSYVDEVFSYISVAFCNKVGKAEHGDEPKTSSTSLPSQIQEQYARVGGVAVEFCVHIKRTDILFDDIFSKFAAVQQGGTFLELLEPYILRDMLGCLPPEIMQALVEHYSNKGWLQRVEQCVLHMDIASLDFNQVVRLCRENGLYGALIYLFNRGLDDFKAPLEELLMVIQNNQRMNATAVGYRMLVYLKYCFLGLAFPPGHGTIHPSRLPLLRTELLLFLLEDSNAHGSQVVTRFKSSSGACPNLCYLLWLDTEATLEVLRCAFVDVEPLKSDQPTDNSADSSMKEDNESNYSNPENKSLMVQNTVNTLIHILEMEQSEVDKSPVTNDNGSIEAWPSEKDIRHLLEFIACFVACEGAIVSKAVLNHILEYLTSDADLSLAATSQKTEAARRKEKLVLAVLKVVPSQDWDSSHVLNLCEKAQFYQVCGFIHSFRGQYLAALDSYMRDVDEPVHAFVFINTMLLQLRESEFAFQSAVLSQIHELVMLSREGTVFLVIDHFSTESHRILYELRSHPKSLFLFLKTVIEVHLSGTLNFASLEITHSSDFPCGRKINGQTDELEAYMERISNFPKLLRHNSIHVTDEMAELYLELLCQYDRHSVLKFLETFENYRLEHCLRLCQEYEVTDAAAFLLERVGDVGSALLLLLSDLDKKLDMLDTAFETRLHEVASDSLTGTDNAFLAMKEVDDVRDMLHVSIGLCQRNTSRLDLQESESLWFRLLDSFCEPLRGLYGDKKISEQRNHDEEASILKFDRGVHILQRVFSDFIREIVEGMVGYISLRTIMAKLLADNGNQEFGDFKKTILGMLEAYSYEHRILDTAKSVIEDDTYYTMSLLKKGASHAYAPQSFNCCICGCSLAKESSSSSIRVFNCGHITHLRCEYLENESSSREDSAGCPICMPKKEKSRSKSKSVLSENGLINNSSSSPQEAHGITSSQYLHEPDTVVEKPYGLQQMSRFELLNNLGKTQKSLQMETLPPLRLTPPAIYHDKVRKGSGLLRGENSDIPDKSEKTSKIRQPRDQKTKGSSSLRFPLKSTIFSTENRRR